MTNPRRARRDVFELEPAPRNSGRRMVLVEPSIQRLRRPVEMRRFQTCRSWRRRPSAGRCPGWARPKRDGADAATWGRRRSVSRRSASTFWRSSIRSHLLKAMIGPGLPRMIKSAMCRSCFRTGSSRRTDDDVFGKTNRHAAHRRPRASPVSPSRGRRSRVEDLEGARAIPSRRRWNRG